MDKEKTDNILFEKIQKEKRKKRRKKLLRVLLIITAVFVLLTVLGASLKDRVDNFVLENSMAVETATVARGSVNTVVTGSGTIQDLDPETVSVPGGVEIEKVLAESNQKVEEGDLLATVKMATVTSSMADIQSQIDSKDEEIAKVTTSGAEEYIKTGVTGRVKIIYAEVGTDVASCVASNNALAVVSQDGWMCVSLPVTDIDEKSEVFVFREDETKYPGKISEIGKGSATILVSDRDIMPGETVRVELPDGTVLGSGEASIHNPIRVIGFTGTVSRLNVGLNQYIYAGNRMFTLTDVERSAQYDLLLKEREDLEKTMLALLRLYRDGGLCAQHAGTILSIDYQKDEKTAGKETQILTLSKDEKMTVQINVNEMDILSLKVGQAAEINIDSAGKESFTGKVTEINRMASAENDFAGAYTATVEFEKADKMMSGMTADVRIVISGKDAVLYVPTAAIHKTSSSAFVYTTYDEVTGEWGGKVQIEIGASNDDRTEVVSGLAEGDTVCYYAEEDYELPYEADSVVSVEVGAT